LEPLVDVRGHQPRLAAAEDRVAGEDDPLLRHVDRELARRMAGRPDAVERVVADPELQEVAGEDDRASGQVGVVVVAVGQDRGAVGVVGRDRLERVGERVERRLRVHEDVPERLVVDDLAGAPEPVVAEDVVDVVLGVDEIADAAVALRLLAHRDGPGRELRRVDDDDAVRRRDEAGVAAAELRRREDVRRDLLELERRRRHRWPPGGYWVAVRPPSIPRTCPVTNDAASEQRKIAGPTRSPSSPMRRIGIRLTIPALNCGSERSDATWGVSTKVGMIAFARMPCFAHSVAHWRVSDAIAPFAATYAE